MEPIANKTGTADYNGTTSQTLGTGTFYGYVKGADGNLEKDEAQAAVVVRIFDMYLDGKSYSGIIDALAEEHIPSPKQTYLAECLTLKGVDISETKSDF